MRESSQREINSWAFYQFAGNGYSVVVITTLLPVYFSQVIASTITHVQSTAYWGYVNGLSLLLASILSPVAGALANHFCIRKKMLFCFTLIGVLLTGALYAMTAHQWLLTLWIYCLSNVVYTLGDMLHDGFLPHLEGRIDEISSRGYAFGYLGGGLLLAIAVALMAFMHDKDLAIRLSFLFVSIWWAVFTIPLMLYVKEPWQSKEGGFAQIVKTFGRLRRYPELLLFLFAFWVYNDGIGTIIKMAAIYGSDIGIGPTTLIGAILMTQFVGIPFSLAFGSLAEKIGNKSCIYLGLIIYTLISIGGYFMSTPLHFWLLAFFVGTVQGGTQALSRSLFGSMVPKTRTAEFYGFYSLSSKVGGIFGPLVFAFVTQATGNSRYSILAIILFFILGAYILTLVNVEKGKREAI